MPSKGVNKAIILGNLGQDPDMRSTNSGSSVANISVATSETWRDKNTGDNQEKTEWHRVVAFGKLAEIMGQYLAKGSKIYIEGRLQTNKWQDQNGVDKYTTQIIANEMQMLDSKPDNNSGQSNAYRHASTGGQKPPQDDLDQDIPF